MDVDFLGLTARSFKHYSPPICSETNDDKRKYCTCPFCYMDIELSMICDHLQEEHCFDVKNAVCPVCALNWGKDVIGHFEVHHASSTKTQRSEKSGTRNFYTGRSSLGGLSAKSGGEDVHGSAPDPLLSLFLFKIPRTVAKFDRSNDSCSDDVSTIPEAESLKPSTPSKSEETEHSKELKRRAAFCQQLIFSTIF